MRESGIPIASIKITALIVEDSALNTKGFWFHTGNSTTFMIVHTKKPYKTASSILFILNRVSTPFESTNLYQFFFCPFLEKQEEKLKIFLLPNKNSTCLLHSKPILNSWNDNWKVTFRKWVKSRFLKHQECFSKTTGNSKSNFLKQQECYSKTTGNPPNHNKLSSNGLYTNMQTILMLRC